MEINPQEKIIKPPALAMRWLLLQLLKLFAHVRGEIRLFAFGVRIALLAICRSVGGWRNGIWMDDSHGKSWAIII